MNKRMMTALLALLLVGCAAPEILAQKKQKTKEKRFEPAAGKSLKDYEGTYVGTDQTYVIEVRLRDDGKLSVSSVEGSRRMTLANVKVEGARLTARAVYADGETVEFEGVFGTRVLNGERAFGLLVDGSHINMAGLRLDRIFYRRDQGF